MSPNLTEFLGQPDWPAPANVRTLQTTRCGGISQAPYDSLNLGTHVGDAAVSVAHNRSWLGAVLPGEPAWLDQVHGVTVVEAGADKAGVQADASVSRTPGRVCVVMTADCLPVLLCDRQGRVVAAVHAGWRGLANGVIEATVHAMGVAPEALLAWLGPAISQKAFEVGEEVREQFVSANPDAESAFLPSPQAGGRYRADLYQLARLRLNALGVVQIYGGEHCTYSEPEHFFSYRRDGVTGRQGSFIWLE